jgi:hypothetical protein
LWAVHGISDRQQAAFSDLQIIRHEIQDGLAI